MKLIRPINVTDSVLISSNIAEPDTLISEPEQWTAGTYNDGIRKSYVTTNVHNIYEVNNPNSNSGGQNPYTYTGTTPYWILVGSTNKWRMFDELMSERTQGDGTISVRLLPREQIDTVALMNISAREVIIVMTDPTDGVVYDHTYSLISDSGIQDWYAYFFEPVVRVSEFAATDLPLFPNAYLDVTLNDPGVTVYCGEMVIGLSRFLGETQYGATIGIQDYSLKTKDDWGNYSITPRAYANRADFTLMVDSWFTDSLKSLLASYRTTPIVYIGSDDFTSTIVYGFYKDFAVDIAYFSTSICTLSVEGLT